MWYDEIGLFGPASVNPENGYRCYNYHQSPLLETILLLRELTLHGFSYEMGINEDVIDRIEDYIVQIDFLQRYLYIAIQQSEYLHYAVPLTLQTFPVLY